MPKDYYFNAIDKITKIFVFSRNEKYLAAVASGKWILHKSYLEASREAGHFIEEEDHEWGTGSNKNDLSASAKRWRLELTSAHNETNKGAFKGWTVLLCIETTKQPGFKRILEAGAGCVHSIRPPFENIDGATHVFIGGKVFYL